MAAEDDYLKALAEQMQGTIDAGMETLVKQQDDALAERTSLKALAKDQQRMKQILEEQARYLDAALNNTAYVKIMKPKSLEKLSDVKVDMAEQIKEIMNDPNLSAEQRKQMQQAFPNGFANLQGKADATLAKQRQDVEKFNGLSSLKDGESIVEFNFGMSEAGKKFIGHMEGENFVLTQIQKADGKFKPLNGYIPSIPASSLNLEDVDALGGYQAGKSTDQTLIEIIKNVIQFQSALDNGTKLPMNLSIPKKLASANQQLNIG